jgi:transcriptional regulator with XRE-family HTH domain
MDFVKATGAAIRAARRAKKLSQKKLAAALGSGWTQKKVSVIETGKQPAHVGQLEQIARVLECDLKGLLIDAVDRTRGPISE